MRAYSVGVEVKPHTFLLPGGLYMGTQASSIKTVLGSCVAVTLWHPRQGLGGMCHIVLPEGPNGNLDTRYADGAFHHFEKILQETCTQAADYQVGLYGGASLLDGVASTHHRPEVGRRNLERVGLLLKAVGFRVASQDVDGPYARRLAMDLTTGRVECRRSRVGGGEVPRPRAA